MTFRPAYILGGLAALFVANAFSPIGLAWNRTTSLPSGLYLARTLTSGAPLARGDLACFTYTPPAWAKGRYYHQGEILCKRIFGVPGDTITTVGSEHHICHDGECTSSGTILNVDTAGRPAEHPVWNNYTLAPGEYYFGSKKVPNSYDSRYLGLISRNIIVKTIVPLLVEKAP